MTLPVLIDSNILPADTWAALSSLSSELSHAHAHRQIFRTETEARISVLDNIHHPTKAAKFWQAMREQVGMLEQLALLSFDYRRNEVNIKRHTRALQEADALDVEDAQINLDECLFKRASMRSVAEDRAREISMWSMLKAELTDGSFDTDNVDAHQLISYATQFSLTAATVKPEQMSGGEFTNLAGQLQTSLARCAETGVLDQLTANLPPSVLAQLQAS